MKNVAFCVVLVLVSCFCAFAQTYKVLWSFGGASNDGAEPVSNLVFDKAGNMYGTTEWGGTGTNDQCGAGCGTVFELSPNGDSTWSETVLYNFCASYPTGSCLDGEKPTSGLASDTVGNLYGVTFNGGAVYCPYASAGCGTVFELSPPQSPGGAWTETVLHSFCSDYVTQCLDGVYPNGHLTFDTSGNLYGTTTGGGNGGWLGGTVFELSPSGGGWTQTVLYNFCTGGAYNDCPDGTAPQAGVTFDTAGNMYGTTQHGGTALGTGAGTVYELSPGSGGWTESVLGFFYPGLGPGLPDGVVSFDSTGNLYTTVYGGASHNWDNGGVLRLNPTTGTVHSFAFNGVNGSSPTAGVLVEPTTGVMYGTSSGSGPNSHIAGNIFKIGPNGETVLYQFCQQANCADGEGPFGSLSAYSGKLYGTTIAGGANNRGVVFEITP
jgi:uncharacterized repeat protein (TIGR03803 family)